MFNVEINRYRFLTAAIATIICLTSCGGNSDDKRAEDLYSQAVELNKNNKFDQALTILDSMDSSCPSAVEIRRKGMSLRPRLIEQITNRKLEIADSIAAVGSYRLDSLSKKTMLVQNSIENYFVPTAEGHVNVGTEGGLHGRMSPDGRLYLIATSPRPVKSVSITVVSGGESASTPSIGFDGERNDRSSGKDVLTFIEAESMDVAKFIYGHRNMPVVLEFNGENNNVSMTLPDNQKSGIADLYEISALIRERKKQELERQRLEKTLQIARSQIARTLDANSEESLH